MAYNEIAKYDEVVGQFPWLIEGDCANRGLTGI